MVDKWFFNNKEVDLVNFTWEVEFDDGSILKQYDDEGRFHQTKEWKKVKVLKINNVIKNQKIMMRIKEDESPVYYYENYILENGARRIRIVVFGIENKIYNYGLENGDVISSTVKLNFNF